MSVWLEQARSYPNGVVATPHYLAIERGPRDARERRQRDRRRARGQPRARCRHAVHVRRRRRPPRDGVGRRRAGVPRRRPRAGGRDARRGARPVGLRRRCRRSARTRARCPARSTAGSRCSSGGGRARSPRSARPRVALRRGRLPAHQARRVRSSRSNAMALEHFGLHDFTQRVRRAGAPGRGCASPRSRARCARSPTTVPTRTTAGRSAPRSPSACSAPAAS